MSKETLAMLLTLAAAGATALAAQPDLSKLPPPAARKDVTYTKDIKPILETSCFRCHGAERPKGGLRLDSLEGALKGSKEGKVITPGTSEKSSLVIAVARLDPETAMPPTPKPDQGHGGPGGRPGGFGASTNASANANAGGPPPGGPGGPGGRGGPGGPGGFGPPPKPL